jgi:hypothetical protein
LNSFELILTIRFVVSWKLFGLAFAVNNYSSGVSCIGWYYLRTSSQNQRASGPREETIRDILLNLMVYF